MITLGDVLERLPGETRVSVEDKHQTKIAEDYAANLRETHLRSILIAPVERFGLETRTKKTESADQEEIRLTEGKTFDLSFRDLTWKIFIKVRLDCTYIGAKELEA